MAQYNFIVNKEDLVDSVPAGEHLCTIEKTEVRETHDGTGEYIKVVFRIIGESYRGMKIFQNFNIKNRNEEAVKIGLKNLSRLCATLGLEGFKDTDEMVGKQTVVKLGQLNKLFGFRKPEITEIAPITDDDIPF